MFGLHPAMAPLEWLWTGGELAAVHAVGMEVPNRSHFLAMEEIEDADPTSSVRRGWVNRMVGLDGAPQRRPTRSTWATRSPRPSLVGTAPVLTTDDASTTSRWPAPTAASARGGAPS